MKIDISIYIEGETKKRVREYLRRLQPEHTVGKTEYSLYINENTRPALLRLLEIAADYGEFPFTVKA